VPEIVHFPLAVKATTRFELADAETENGRSPYVLLGSGLNVTVWSALLTVRETDFEAGL
jgi:hypothetical protein